MDYDDNDISHHNLQLAGDSRSKASTVLKPYDFPKFDFDDSLQAHLRFDTLVETEVFLGIQSQEDNQWIEDFSRDSNGMEFNSTPADSCSIPKRSNVWSEATSSESVEMLLKSVGQEEMMPGESIPELKAGHDLGTLAKRVEPVSELDAKNDENPANSEIMLPQDKLQVDHPASKRLVEEQLPDVEDSSVTQENVKAVSVKSVTPINEGKHPCHDENSTQKLSTEKPVSFEAGTDPLHFTGFVVNTNSDLGMLSTSKMSEQVNISFESCNNVERESFVPSGIEQEESKILEENAGKASAHVHTVDNFVGWDGESGVFKSQDTVEVSDDCSEEIADVKTDGGIELKSSEEGKNVSSETLIQTDKHEIKVLPLNNEMSGTFDGFQDVSAKGGSDQHSAELGSQNAEDFVVSKQNIDSSAQLIISRDIGNMREAQTSPSKGESTYEMPLISGNTNKFSLESSDCIDTTNIITCSEIVVLSSTTETSAAENVETDNVVVCHSDSLVSVEKSGTQLPATILDDSKLGIEKLLAQRQAVFPKSELDARKTNADKEPPIDTEFVDPENVESLADNQMTQSSGVNEGVKVKNVSPHALSSSLADEQGNETENAKQTSVIGLSSSDNDPEEHATRLVSCVNFETEEVNVVKVEVSVAPAAARPLRSEMDANSLTVEESNAVSSCESPSTEAIKCSSSDHSQVHLGCDKSSLKESVNADVVSYGNLEATMLKVEGVKETEQAAEIDKASCGSPTIISSTEPSQMEKNNQEVRGTEATDQFVKIQPFLEDPKRNDSIGDDSTFTFKVNALPDVIEGDPGRTWSPFPNVEKCSSSVIVEETNLSVEGKTARTPKQKTPKETKLSGEGKTARTPKQKTPKETKLSGEGKTARTPKQKTPRQSARTSDGEHVHGTSKGTSERKGRKASAKGIAKENTKKENQISDTNTEGAEGDKVSVALMSTSGSGTHVQIGNMQLYKHIEQIDTKISGAVVVPDLNNSALNNSNSPSASFRQPFTDLQQVQLRAQIFVYGSLIQGTPPDEACMVSAFGSSDGRSIWEPVWRAAIERVRSKKSNSSAPETPLHTQSVARASDATLKQGSGTSKTLSSPVARVSSKGTPATFVNPLIPLSSPLWSISTPARDNFPPGTHKGSIVDYQHLVSPLHSFQTPPIRNFVGHTSWPSQPCFPGQWLASPQSSTFNTSVHIQPVTMTETVKLTPVRDTSGPLTSSMKHVTSSPPVQSVVPNPVYVGPSLLPDPLVIASAEVHSVDSKSRKRKKNKPSDAGQVSLISEARTEPVDINLASILSPSPVVPASNSFTPSSPASDAILTRVATPVAMCSTDQPRKGNLDAGKVVTCSEETLSKVAEAKTQAENAAALAAATVSHSEDLWRQLAEQKDSGKTSDVEAKLASAAVAISAAASVAKAAAAAAKVACNVALQAKIMADEAFESSKTSGLIPSSGKYSADVQDIGNATPASILKSDNLINRSNSILLAAKEAAKRRVEAATAASKQAENLDAIVKAAELAATAVSQAGKIVAMGEPFPLNDLIEAGPEGYWGQPSSNFTEKPQDCNKEQSGAAGTVDSSGTPSKGSRKDSGMKGAKTVDHSNILPGRRATDGLVNGIRHPIHTGESDCRSGKETIDSDPAKTCEIDSEPDPFADVGTSQNDHDELVGSSPEVNIKEGSAVEVYKHGNDLKSAWFSAKVKNLQDEKVYVSYTDVPSEEGSGKFCEWVSLKGDRDQAPVIRSAHPSFQFQGTKKRPRAALGDYDWCVGDRVDVWIDDCWWEGVVTEKNENDETRLKVHFPAQGETSTVRAWDLRTSRLWKNGKWFEWSSSKGRNVSESDTPKEKRQRMGSPAVPVKGKDKLATDVDAASGKQEESKLLKLSTSDRVFDVGKTTKEENKRAARKPLRAGQLKEGSRVIFGVPKPTGKKRKFMEVSKQFPANIGEKKTEVNDSVKFAKFLIPQASMTAQGVKVSSRNVPKEKQIAESRLRVPSSRKSNRTLAQNDNLKDRGKSIEDSVGHDDGMAEKSSHDFPASGAEAPLASLIAKSQSSSSKKFSSFNFKSERLNRGKLAYTLEKINKVVKGKEHTDDAGKSAPEAAEPRRSNRRTQPTHRLLEGLQSSMVIPKMPSVSHDRVQRNPSRNVFGRGK